MQPGSHVTLPEPDAAAADHSRKVADSIRRKIDTAGGEISFAEFMHHALYAPGFGYYAAGATKFGRAGDFITAPEISPLFGQVIARQCAAVLAQTATPSVLEIGAGSGRLAIDILGKLGELDAMPESYEILEVSADLRQRQKALILENLPQHADRVRWLDDWPRQHQGIVVANEVLDALPVERFTIGANGPEQHCVARDGEGFTLSMRPAPDPLARAVADIENDLGRVLPEGYTSEVCLALPGWIADLAAVLDKGMALLFDYGVSRRDYYAADRSGGWLRCHFRHRAHTDALRLPGIQDISAWVDFTAVASAAIDHGLDIAGFVTQAQFMLEAGLDEELAGMPEMPIDAQLKLANEVKLLTLPGEMGEHFKCIGLRRGPVRPPSGLSNMDRTAAL